MIRQEEISYRSTKFSTWHRKLPNYCYFSDLDFVEVRATAGGLRIAAIIEGKGPGDNPTRFQLSILRLLSKNNNCPAFVIYHNEDLSNFKIVTVKNVVIKDNVAKEVWRIEKNEKGTEFGYPNIFKEFTEKEMAEFIKNL